MPRISRNQVHSKLSLFLLSLLPKGSDLLAPIKLLFLMPELSETAWSLEASSAV